MTRVFVHQARLETLVRSSSGRIMNITFTKADGSLREMRCRTGVKKGVKGTGRRPGLHTATIPVFDMEKEAWRSFNLDRVHTVSMDKKKFIVVK